MPTLDESARVLGTSQEWKALFLEVFADKAASGAFAAVNWDEWFHSPGMPPVMPTLDTSLADACSALAARYASG